jgi:hypothetical protein
MLSMSLIKYLLIRIYQPSRIENSKELIENLVFPMKTILFCISLVQMTETYDSSPTEVDLSVTQFDFICRIVARSWYSLSITICQY